MKVFILGAGPGSVLAARMVALQNQGLEIIVAPRVEDLPRPERTYAMLAGARGIIKAWESMTEETSYQQHVGRARRPILDTVRDLQAGRVIHAQDLGPATLHLAPEPGLIFLDLDAPELGTGCGVGIIGHVYAGRVAFALESLQEAAQRAASNFNSAAESLVQLEQVKAARRPVVAPLALKEVSRYTHKSKYHN